MVGGVRRLLRQAFLLAHFCQLLASASVLRRAGIQREKGGDDWIDHPKFRRAKEGMIPRGQSNFFEVAASNVTKSTILFASSLAF